MVGQRVLLDSAGLLLPRELAVGRKMGDGRDRSGNVVGFVCPERIQRPGLPAMERFDGHPGRRLSGACEIAATEIGRAPGAIG